MAYQTLRTLYYGDQHVYLETYQSRFHSEDTVRTGFLVAQNPAFFVQSAEVLRLAYEIMKRNQSVMKLSVELPRVAKNQYFKKCLIDEIVLTNKIEGVHSSRQEIDSALEVLSRQTREKGKRRRFLSLVNKYLKLLMDDPVPLASCQDIRDIYDEILLEEVTAEDPRNAPDGKIFRKEITAIRSQTDRVIHKGLYPEQKIIDAMEQALAFLNDSSVDALFRICVFHYMIEYIHPFYDGNGRLGRFILSDCLSKVLEPLLSYRISETIQENISEYYKAFQVCNDPHNLGDLTPFLIMLLRMICTALEDLEVSLNNKLVSWRRYEALVSSFPESADGNIRGIYNVLIQTALFSEKGISTAELEKSLGKSYYRVKKLLEQVRPELLLSERKGKANYYQIDLQALDRLLLEDGLREIHAGPCA